MAKTKTHTHLEYKGIGIGTIRKVKNKIIISVYLQKGLFFKSIFRVLLYVQNFVQTKYLKFKNIYYIANYLSIYNPKLCYSLISSRVDTCSKLEERTMYLLVFNNMC